ncbi:MAG: hypothetical protein EA361_15825 [Bacteroidetes bacterium]|nr:MAG: hypothetical protein EA361_15825 [Bacteroidota bacterium]
MKTARDTLFQRIKTEKIHPFTLHTWKALFVSLIMMLSPVYVFPQACCSGGVPLGGSLGLGTAENKSLQFLLTYDYNLLNDLMDGSKLLKDGTRSRTTHSAMVEVNYGLSPRFSLTAVIPFIRQERNISTFGGGQDFTATQGLGDAVFLVKYKILNPEKRPKSEWVMGAGPKFSTGRTDHTNNAGLALAADMQPGSGSLDGIFWSYFQRRQIISPNFSLMAVTTYRYSGNNNNYNNTQVYRFGNELQLNVGGNYNLFISRPVDVFTYLRYRRQAADLIDGNAFPGSGGQWIDMIPGVNVNFNPNLSVRLSGQLPVYRIVEGTQLTTSYRLTAAILYNIPSKEKLLITL